MTDTSAASSRRRPNWILWFLKGLVALAFLVAAFQKIAGQTAMVRDFEEIGLGQGFRYVTAVIEGLGALLLLWPRTVPIGALVLLGICSGALAAQIGPLHGDVIHVFVLGGLAAIIGVWDRMSRR